MQKIKGGTSLQIKTNSRRAIKQKGFKSGGSYSTIRAWFRSRDLWVMGPPRFRCATLIVEYRLYQNIYSLSVRQSSVPFYLFLFFGCLSFKNLLVRCLWKAKSQVAIPVVPEKCSQCLRVALMFNYSLEIERIERTCFSIGFEK